MTSLGVGLLKSYFGASGGLPNLRITSRVKGMMNPIRGMFNRTRRCPDDLPTL